MSIPAAGKPVRRRVRSRRANLAAARMIARQLRLRQLGGGIVVDFAALDAPRERERVRQAIAAALAGDPARPQLLGWTRLGHLEIVRPRRFRSISEAMLEVARGVTKARRHWHSRRCACWRPKPAQTRHGIGAWLSFRLSRRHCADRRPRRSLPWKCVSGAGSRSRRQRAASRAPPITIRSLLTSWPCEPISAAWPIPAVPLLSRRSQPARANARPAASAPFRAISHSAPAAAPISILADG